MNNFFRKGLTLLMVLCLLVPLFGLSVLAADTLSDYQFTEVKESSISGSLKGISNDPFSALQWNLKAIGMEEAWRSGLTGKGVVVAIVDSGLSGTTMDIDKDRILPGKNCVGGTGVTDALGHGTFIAGIIGATKDNHVGVAGIAPGVTIAPIKSYASSETDFAAQAAGIYAAVDEYHCDILNISAGDPEIVPEVQAAIEHALDEGVIVIAASGNSGDKELLYPASYDGVISVSSVDKDLVISATSNRNERVFVAAPGVGVYSLGRLPGTVTLSSGTSFAAPVVAGVAALLKEAWPQMTPDDFMEILKVSCKDLSTKGRDIYYGWGLVQAPDAIRAAAAYFGDEAPDMSQPDNPGSSWSDFFSFNWLREIFQNIIRSIFKGWATNLSF
ncbi:MAG: S8 family serine peptidase [Oscillospiraceae bacterium]|nr:S8 family serine peptidase [Oscillospiraceae bacterium]MBQ6402715.1 S8 family serine peptidase [Oscillospiraceae bacterium]